MITRMFYQAYAHKERIVGFAKAGNKIALYRRMQYLTEHCPEFKPYGYIFKSMER